MGGVVAQNVCVKYYCEIDVNNRYCVGADPQNPCDRDQADQVYCMGCCDVKFDCCMLTKGYRGAASTEACKTSHDHCDIDRICPR